MSEAQKGLQLLVDSFAGSEDPEERDELLQDIIAHPLPQALGFLRLVASNADEDRYLKCDAICALCTRTAGAEQLEGVLIYLSNPYDAYEYSSACAVIGAVRIEAALGLIMQQLDAPLEEACLDASIDAVAAVGGKAAATALSAWLDAQTGKVDEARALLVIGAIERLRIPGSDASLRAFAERVRVAPDLAPLAAAATDAIEAMARPQEEDTEDEE